MSGLDGFKDASRMSDIEVGSVWTGQAADEVTVTGVSGDYVAYSFRYGNGESDSAYYTLANFEKHHKLLRGADMVNEPPHYKDESGIECIEVTKHMGFCGGNCFKYLYRAGKKGSTVEDLKKAAWYAERAWIGNELVAEFLHTDIKHIASNRNKYIGQAINAVSESDWHKVYDLTIKAVVRLESEGDQ